MILIKNESIRGTISNGVHTVSSIINLLRLFNDINLNNRIFGILSTVSLGAITAMHARNIYLTETKLKEIQSVMKEFDEKKIQLKRIGLRLDIARKSLKTK